MAKEKTSANYYGQFKFLSFKIGVQKPCRFYLQPQNMTIGERIIHWYNENGRKMPWRETTDAYKIWISEVILQQTRVAQGENYYYRFIERFPNIKSLATAEIDEVMKYWEGLGYYSRARNLHAAAQQLMNDYGGKFPETHEEIIKLKGLGPYSSRAIGSFAFGNVTGVIDGNVFRVMSRVLNDFSPIDAPSTRLHFQLIIDKWVHNLASSPFNQGIMDIGSTICTPTQPACLLCPLEDVCGARNEGSITLLPVKGKKMVRKTRYFHFYLIENEQNEILIRRRAAKGIWGGLWEIPSVEVEKTAWDEKKSDYPEAQYFHALKHIFTHFDMELQVFRLPLENYSKTEQEIAISKAQIDNYSFPKAILKVFEKYIKA